MSQDDDQSGKPPGKPFVPTTTAGFPAPRQGLPPPKSGPGAGQRPSAPAMPPGQQPEAPPPHEAPPYVAPQPPYAPPPAEPFPPMGYGNIPQAQVVAGDAGARPQYVPSAELGSPNAPQHSPGTESNPIAQIADVFEKVPGRFVAFLKISTKRAFRLRIEPSEVLPDERQTLAQADPPILDENLQAFLAWRRSVLFLVATILVPLSIIGIVDAFSGSKVAPAVRYVKLLPAVAETLFCVICWLQLRHWAHWRSQRRWLFFGWLLFIGTPFLVFAYPLKEAFMGLSRSMSIAQVQELGWNGVYNRAIAPFAFSMIAMFQLAPKVISLMPGLIRSSMVIKLLFPGSAAPGWLIVMSAPLYALIAYALLIIPYQFTGELWFIFGIGLIVFAQALVAKSGFQLARPLTQDEAMFHIKRVRKYYMTLLLIALCCIVGGLGVLAKILSIKWTTIASTLLKFEANVLTLTIIGADLVVTNLDRARHYTEGKEHVEEETEDKIAAFVGLNKQA